MHPPRAGGNASIIHRPVARKPPPVATELEPTLVQSYRDAVYTVHHAPPFHLRVDHASVGLERLYAQTRTRCGAFITACNPHGEQRSDDDNTYLQAQLAQQLNQRGLPYLGGLGQDPNGQWPNEPSFVVPGLTLEAAKKLGRQFAQNAIVWCGADTVPRLELLR